MTQEDKAKAYDEALDRARRLHGEPTGGTERIVCEQIFPELAEENEDERIRREILEHIQFCSESIPDRDNFIAWLEKQGEHKHTDKVEVGNLEIN